MYSDKSEHGFHSLRCMKNTLKTVFKTFLFSKYFGSKVRMKYYMHYWFQSMAFYHCLQETRKIVKPLLIILCSVTFL